MNLMPMDWFLFLNINILVFNKIQTIQSENKLSSFYSIEIFYKKIEPVTYATYSFTVKLS